MPSAECAVVVTVATSPDRPLACNRAGLGRLSVAAIDRKGDFHAATPLCVGAEQSTGELVFAVGRDTLAGLWLSDGKEAVLLGIE
jgi:hypothetical protein